jgi:hypothetical protein
MKTFRFLLVMVFVLAFFAGSAGALGGDTERGYLPLPVRADPSIPLRVQAQDAYERFLPVLLAAQRSGLILEYHPMFAGGIVEVRFLAGARPAMLGGVMIYADLHAAASQVQRGARQEGELRTAYDPRFDVEVYESCVGARGLVSGDRLTGSLYDDTGRRLAVVEDDADATGEAWDCWDGVFNDVLPGYQVTLKVYTAGGALRGTYQATAPSMTIDAFNKASSIASGEGPAGKPYVAVWYHDNLDAGDTTLTVMKTGTISGTGTWSKDFGAKPFRGGDDVELRVKIGTRFWFGRWLNVPFSYCYLGDNYCAMYGFPNQAVFITLTHAGTPRTSTGISDFFDGWFGYDLVDSNGMPLFLVAGDKFWGTNISLYNLPNLTANFNYATDVVSGKAPPNKYFLLEIWDPTWAHYSDAWTHSNASGNYSVNIHASWDVKTSDPFVVEISYQNPASGNKTYMYKAFGP